MYRKQVGNKKDTEPGSFLQLILPSIFTHFKPLNFIASYEHKWRLYIMNNDKWVCIGSQAATSKSESDKIIASRIREKPCHHRLRMCSLTFVFKAAERSDFVNERRRGVFPAHSQHLFVASALNMFLSSFIKLPKPFIYFINEFPTSMNGHNTRAWYWTSSWDSKVSVSEKTNIAIIPSQYNSYTSYWEKHARKYSTLTLDFTVWIETLPRQPVKIHLRRRPSSL